MGLTSIYKVTHDNEIAKSLTAKLIRNCASDIVYRKNFDGVDTAILRDAADGVETEDRSKMLKYEPSTFRVLYQQVADEFERSFAACDFDKLPFSNGYHYERFIIDLWKSYFLNEMSSVIDTHSDYAVLIIKSITFPEKSSERAMSQITRRA